VTELNLTLAGDKSTLTGELTRKTITRTFEKKSRNLCSSTRMAVDLSQVDKIDTAGLAWLLYVVEQAMQHSCQLTFTHVPKEILQLASLNGVDSFLPK